MFDDSPFIMKSADIASFLKVDRKKLKKLREEYGLPCYRLGDAENSPYYSTRPELIKWATAQMRKNK